MPSKIAQFHTMSFNMAYTLAGNTSQKSTIIHKRITAVVMILDLLQTLRVLCPQVYGWNKSSVDFFQLIDVVFAVTDVVSKLIPRWWLIIVSGAFFLATAAGVVALTRQMRTARNHYPKVVIVLRLVVKAQIGVFFISFFQWFLMSFDCLIWEQERFSMSKEFHTSAEPCRPWQVPEIILTVLGIVLAVAMLFFSQFAATFLVEINPLCRRSMSMWMTQVESRWIMTRALFVVLLYISPQISEIGASVIATFLAFSILRMHINIMPFQDSMSNYIRGGVYAAATGAGASSALLSIIGEDGTNQTFQWVLIVLISVWFMGGLAMVKDRRRGLTNSLNRLRGEWEAQETIQVQSVTSHAPGSPGPVRSKPISDRESARGGRSVVGSRKNAPQAGGGQVTSRTLFDKFFDASWETKRAFSFDMEAVVTGRELLNNRSESDLDFLEYLMSRGLEEHPGSAGILLFKIAVLHFVIQDSQRAAQLEKEARKKNEAFPMSQKYILFAIARRTDQEMVNHAWGNNGMTVSKLVEIDASVDRARRAHLQCLSKLRSFWKQVRKLHRTESKNSRRIKDSQEDSASHSEKKYKISSKKEVKAKGLMGDLSSFDGYMTEAEQEYIGLMEKYPNSLPVLQSCAAFYDVVINDFVVAEELNERVAAIYNQREAAETGFAKGLGPQPVEVKKEEDGGSTASGQTSSRSIIAKHMQNLKLSFLNDEEMILRRISTTVNLGLLIILLIAIGLFIFTDRYLFSTRALINIVRMEASGKLRHMAVEGCYFLRSQVLATQGHHSHEEWVDAKQHIERLAVDMRELHRETYDVSGSSMKEKLTQETEAAVLPLRGVWVSTPFSFWTLLNDFIRRMELASTNSEEELEDPNFDLLESSIHKMNIAYCNENIFRSIVPAIDHTVLLYEDQVYLFGKLKSTIVIISCVGEGAIIAALAAYILWWTQKLISRIQHHAVCVCASLSIPQKYSRRFLHFYEDHEVNLMILQDEDGGEDMEREQIMENPENHEFENQDSTKAPEFMEASNVDDGEIYPELPVKEKAGGENTGRRSSLGKTPSSRGSSPTRKQTDKESITFGEDTHDDHTMESRMEREKQDATDSVNPVLMEQIRGAVRKQVAWFQRWQVIVLATMVLIGLAALSIAYPSAEIPHLVNLAPTANQGSRRRLLVVTIAHLVRELVLDDGLSRLNKNELSGAVHHNLEMLKEADRAVRLGNAMKIKAGADHHSPEHNELMYTVNCLWVSWNEEESTTLHRRSGEENSTAIEPERPLTRKERRREVLRKAGKGWHRRAGGVTSHAEFDASQCSNSSRPDAVQNGLYYLLLSFYDAVENILARYGSDESQFSMDYIQPREGIDVANMYTWIEIDTEKQDLLETDPDIVFVLEALEGDLFKAMGLALEDFNLEMPRILSAAHFELEITFSVLVIWLILVYYLLLFRPSMALAMAELQKSREFLLRLPLQLFPIREVDQIVSNIAISSKQLYESPILRWPLRKKMLQADGHDDD